MHVALFSPGWPLERHYNGVVTYVHWMKRELERRGHRVTVFVVGMESEGPHPGVHSIERDLVGTIVRRIAGRFFSPQKEVFKVGTLIAKGIWRIHRRDPIDIIEMEESFGWSEAVERITGIPVVVKLHGPAFLSLVEEELATNFGRARVEREGVALAAAGAIASPCAITLSQTIERYGLAPAISEHVANPMPSNLDVPQWSLQACEQDTLLFVGRFDSRKGGDLVIKAFALLSQSRPALRLIFVGPDVGLLHGDGTRVKFDAFCAATLPAGMRARIDYRGRLPQYEIAALRLQARVTVVASRWENPGYTALEAMMQGCPVVCSDAGGCPEIIAHGRTGLLARSGDSADLAVQIGIMLDDPSAAVAMGAAARSFVAKYHAVETIAAQSLDLYRRVIANARLGGAVSAPRAR